MRHDREPNICDFTCTFLADSFNLSLFSSRPGSYYPEFWVGVCGSPLETLTLFQTKICDFPYSSSDLPQVSDHSPTLLRLLKHTRQSSLTSLRKKINIEVASSKNCTQLQNGVHILYPISDQSGPAKSIP